MSKQGYLIVHESSRNSRKSKICFFVLLEGTLDCYSEQNGELLSSTQLSGHKVKLQKHRRQDKMANSFILESRKVFSKGQTYSLGPTKKLYFTTCNNTQLHEWGAALMTWNRYYFRDLPPEDSSETHQNTLSSLCEILQRPLPKKNSFLKALTPSSSKVMFKKTSVDAGASKVKAIQLPVVSILPCVSKTFQPV